MAGTQTRGPLGDDRRDEPLAEAAAQPGQRYQFFEVVRIGAGLRVPGSAGMPVWPTDRGPRANAGARAPGAPGIVAGSQFVAGISGPDHERSQVVAVTLPRPHELDALQLLSAECGQHELIVGMP